MLGYRFKQGVRAEIIDDEAIVVSFETGKYYAMRNAAAEVIRALIDVKLVGFRGLAGAFGLAEGSDELAKLTAFVESLLSESVIEAVSVEAAGAVRPVKATAFSFELETFDELADILVLDPIHEVSEAGWPERAR